MAKVVYCKVLCFICQTFGFELPKIHVLTVISFMVSPINILRVCLSVVIFFIPSFLDFVSAGQLQYYILFSLFFLSAVPKRTFHNHRTVMSCLPLKKRLNGDNYVYVIPVSPLVFGVVGLIPFHVCGLCGLYLYFLTFCC